MASLQLPPGTNPTTSDPDDSTGLASPPECPSTPDLVDYYGYWQSPDSTASLLGWLRANPPAGSTVDASGTIGTAAGQAQFLAFSWPPVAGVSQSRTLTVTAEALPDGDTGVRADAQVVWLNPRPSSEQVPAGTMAAAVTFTPPAKSPSTYDVTDPSTLSQIISLTDALPAEQPGAEACPALAGTAVQVVFIGVNGSTLAEADTNGAGCGTVNFSIGGVAQPTLTNGFQYVASLESAVGGTPG